MFSYGYLFSETLRDDAGLTTVSLRFERISYGLTPHPGPLPLEGRGRSGSPVPGLNARNLVSGNSLPVEGRGRGQMHPRSGQHPSSCSLPPARKRKRWSSENTCQITKRALRDSLSPQRGEGRGRSEER